MDGIHRIHYRHRTNFNRVLMGGLCGLVFLLFLSERGYNMWSIIKFVLLAIFIIFAIKWVINYLRVKKELKNEQDYKENDWRE
ncbi:MAG TPA: hypothetical protein VJ455_00335 [Ignavibacteria bacterium]|nr:hypothetical protein [Ignavibacteria bacterium]